MLTREHTNQIIEILKPHISDSVEDRRALMQRAFFDEPIVERLTYSGQAVTFAMNCVLTLKRDYSETAVVQLLKTIREYYHIPHEQKETLDALLSELSASSEVLQDGDRPFIHKQRSENLLFISYSRKDLTFVNRLREDLRVLNIPYWIDREGLYPGTPNWERAIRNAIRDCSSVLWIVSPAAYESEYVSSELAVAEMYHRRIYPVWADGDNWVACVPLGKHNIQFVDMRMGLYTDGLQQLLRALKRSDSEFIVPVKVAPEPPVDTEPRNPYKGLTPFTEADADDFFGRESLIDSLTLQLSLQISNESPRFLVVLGPSGAGKSSVVMAGLLPALRNNAIPDSENWYLLPTITPGKHPMERLAEALSMLIHSAESSTVLANLYAFGLEYLNIAFDMLPTTHVLLYIDQFEELFTLAEDDGEREIFISLLVGAATEPAGKLIVLVSMRADFLDYPLNYSQLGTLFNQYNVLVQPMSIPELRDAVEKPAQLPDVGLSFDDGLVADIVFALRGHDKALTGALPLLQFALDRLFQERTERILTRESYEAMGGIGGAIGSHSEAVFTALPQAAQEKLGEVFLKLINIDQQTGEATRRRSYLADIAKQDDSLMLVNALVENRLLQAGMEGEKKYIEVSHEALFRSWDRLRGWISSARSDLILLNQVRTAAIEWVANGHPGYLLWSQERIDIVQAMVRRLGIILEKHVLEFLEPEWVRLLRELQRTGVLHPRRMQIGERLSFLGDSRSGVGIGDLGIPQIAWVEITGGTTSIEGTIFDTGPFYISKFPVTCLQFRSFVDAADGYYVDMWWNRFPEKYRQQHLNEVLYNFSNYPMHNVSWYQASAYCAWLSGNIGVNHPGSSDWEIRLPFEWEWQYAAQSGDAETLYPWGPNWDENRANTLESGLGRPNSVGLYPDGETSLGIADLSGNINEWCWNDHYRLNERTYNDASRRPMRGGSFSEDRLYARVTSRYNHRYPNEWDVKIGFRVVLAPKILA